MDARTRRSRTSAARMPLLRRRLVLLSVRLTAHPYWEAGLRRRPYADAAAAREEPRSCLT